MITSNDITGAPGTYRALEALKHSDWEIVDGEPDITGWNVFSSQGSKLGEVSDLLFDPSARKVRYIVLDTDVDETEDEKRKVLIPIGVAQMQASEDEVIIPHSSGLQVSTLPAYKGSTYMSATDEQAIRAVFEPGLEALSGYTYPQFYEHPHFDEDKFYNRKVLSTGDAAVNGRWSHRKANPRHPGEEAAGNP